MAKKKTEEKKNSYITVEIDENGTIGVKTNLSGLGAIHLMSSGTRLIIERSFEQQEAEEKEAEKESTIEQ